MASAPVGANGDEQAPLFVHQVVGPLLGKGSFASGGIQQILSLRQFSMQSFEQFAGHAMPPFEL
jgi:hypothetical protein